MVAYGGDTAVYHSGQSPAVYHSGQSPRLSLGVGRVSPEQMLPGVWNPALLRSASSKGDAKRSLGFAAKEERPSTADSVLEQAKKAHAEDEEELSFVFNLKPRRSSFDAIPIQAPLPPLLSNLTHSKTHASASRFSSLSPSNLSRGSSSTSPTPANSTINQRSGSTICDSGSFGSSPPSSACSADSYDVCPSSSMGVSRVDSFGRTFGTYSSADLEAATNGWAEENILGKGGYGTVYKGRLEGQMVAIKRLEGSGWQGPKEYAVEVAVLSGLQSPHTVRLLGHAPDTHCLVYEYISGGNLSDYLRRTDTGSAVGLSTLGWRERLRIMSEVASALGEMHAADTPVVHRDLKPENILLTKERSAKVGDVGLARLMEQGDDITYTVSGTAGYIDPESMTTFQISPLADVYAFGLILLQLLLGLSKVTAVHRILESVPCKASTGGRRMSAALAATAKQLDCSGGIWPPHVSQELLLIALRCTERKRALRPTLKSTVIPILTKLMKAASTL